MDLTETNSSGHRKKSIQLKGDYSGQDILGQAGTREPGSAALKLTERSVNRELDTVVRDYDQVVRNKNSLSSAKDISNNAVLKSVATLE